MKPADSAKNAVIALKVQPGSGRNEITDTAAEIIRVRVTAAPEHGKANRAVAELLAERLGLPKSRVTIVRGLTSRRKVAAVAGLSEAEVREKLGKTD
ncbi:protein of unknown function DUF167 [Dehalogenimonas lykanthroporepellens BL-DC-9]|nr:protein of unknown function DUF167 [Dehalogenimonas lykanthroporepellens BL-DC-9]